MSGSPGSLLDTERAGLQQRARQLAWFTIVWNVVEAVVSIGAGVESGSLALVGFGVDAAIETGSAVLVLWRFAGVDDEREELALRGIGVSFLLLAAFVGANALRDLVVRDVPDVSAIGIGITATSLVVMPLLARAKSRVGRELGSAVVVADSAETWLCTYLSAIVLAGLALNAAFGWWWADPVAALAVAGLAVREGVEAWRGETDCC